MSETAIRLTNVSKRFKLYNNPITGPIMETLFFWNRKEYYEEFMAIRNLSLEVKRGEVVGIIGPNGAGKTTILKMIAGLLPVDQGTIEVNGNVTALLALGVGVHPEFTGRENIFYHGLLLGMSKEEVLRKMPETIEFAELGDYIDRPFRTYSSGMKARLLFASSMSIEPDILIVDEALATGDSAFVQKSSEKISQLCSSGATILYVSHNLAQIEQLCHKSFLMTEGQIVYEGEPKKVIGEYNRLVFEEKRKKIELLDESTMNMLEGTREVQLKRVRLLDKEGVEQKAFYTNDTMVVELDYVRLNKEIKKVSLFIAVCIASTGEWVAEYTNFQEDEYRGLSRETAAVDIEDEGTISVEFSPCLLLTNTYTLWIVLASAAKEDAVRYCEYRGECPFVVAKPSDPIGIGPVFKMPGTATSTPSLPSNPEDELVGKDQ